jgi:hypothetical protein
MSSTTVSDLLALGLQLLHYRTVPCTGQHPAQIDHLLDVDVLVLGTGENLGLCADVNKVFAVVALFDGPYGFQQRQYCVPLDVVTRGMLKDLQERVTVTAVKVPRI